MAESMNPYTRDFPTDNPTHWHDEAAQRDALEALKKKDFPALERIFHEARGLSLVGILKGIIKEKL
jgi:hypothetical protein